MAIDLRQMRHVLALAEHGSFARAAEALRLSQPALSRSIQGIERQIGTEIYLRTATGVTPTDIGRLLIQRARLVLQLAEDLDREVLGNQSLNSGHVAVGAGPFPAETTLSTALARFVSAYPQVNVRLQVRDWDELLRRLRSRELDFFVAETSTLMSDQDLTVEPMSNHALHFIARAGHPLCARQRVTAADTFEFPFISPARIPPLVLEPMLAAQRTTRHPLAASRAFPSLECNSLSTVKRIVAASDAVTAVTLSCISAELDSGVFELLDSAPRLTLHYGLVRLKGHPASTAAGKFREFILDAERELALQEKHLLARWRPRRGPAKTPGRGRGAGRPAR